MLELIAQGATADTRWRRKLPSFPVEMGRTTDSYRVPWDPQISRRHVRLTAGENEVTVEKLPQAANPVFHDGADSEQFRLQPGEHFVIGSTTFLLTADQAFGSLEVPHPIDQRTLSSEFLKQVAFRDADRQLEVLNRIPAVISNANDPQELLIGMVNLLMSGIGTATTIGVVRLQQDVSSQTDVNDETHLEVIHWDRRGLARGDFQPSEKLVEQAVRSGESVLNVWQSDVRVEEDHYTFDYEHDWAFACPIESSATRGWSIYVAGRNRIHNSDDRSPARSPGQDLELEGDIKFCELVGSTLKNILQVKRLERQQASLRTFFSPVVVEALRHQDPEQVLAPRKCNVTVLFCDLRGFARTSEQMSDDLLGLLERVSDALGFMTGAILDAGGVIGDFHGDAVMGFWGWPLESDRGVDNVAGAIQAAEAMEDVFAQQLCDHPRLQNFQIGLGIATGPAVAGKIGTRDQVKVTAFGPVVNLASRLEAMTRQLQSLVLCDRTTADRIAELPDEARPLTRRLGRFLPFGLQRPVDVFQLHRRARLTSNQLEGYREALSHFEAGRWEVALTQLKGLPAEDSARRFLESHILQQSPPAADFDGTIVLSSKI